MFIKIYRLRLNCGFYGILCHLFRPYTLPSSALSLTFINNVYAQGGEYACQSIFCVKGLAQADAACDRPHNGDERIVYRHLADGVTAEQLVIECEACGRDADEQEEADDALGVDNWQGATDQETRNHEQQPAYGKAETRADKDIYSSAQPSYHQACKGYDDGIDDYHTVPQPREAPTIRSAKVESHDAAEADDAAEKLPQRHPVALEAETSQQYHKEGAHGIEDCGTRAHAVRHADVEEEIVQRGVHERKGEDKPPVTLGPYPERVSATTRDSQDNKPRRGKANACIEHLAACHFGRDAKGRESDFDDRKGPSPGYCGSKGKYRYPERALK